MNTLEIKGAFIRLLAEIEDPSLLQKMLDTCLNMANREDMLEALPQEALSALEAAELDESLSDTLSNDEVFKGFRTWKKP
ncbi:MAG: hypothetical protein KDC66_21260 [Phaeodactylibacter sp.]|nr:hypothetical protein [Phaeodactylibacter sp.]MCB9276536.1 hypothetical protein [Lewinellaceae bacterium]